MATAAVASSVKNQTSPSPFAELLRRSRFSRYDPAIRQTFRSAPPNAHRGDWGLKRPIALRRRNSFITINGPFERHSQYIEWNNAESEVRFIRAFQEMDITPRIMHHTPWHDVVGNAEFRPLLDSEFCPGEGYEMNEAAKLDIQKKNMTLDLTGLGNRGPGKYNASRGPPQRDVSGQVTENLEAMSTKQFSRYLRKLRKLRPEFKAYLEQSGQSTDTSLYALAQNHEVGHHRKFIRQHLVKEFSSIDSTNIKIEPQPHPNAGLLYARPTTLDTRMHATPQPGILLNVLNTQDNGRFSQSSAHVEQKYVASFGGFTAVIPKSGADGKRPLLDTYSETGVDLGRVEESVVNMRPAWVDLVSPPKVVGHRPQRLDDVKLEVHLSSDGVQFVNDNPYPPGSTEYNACSPTSGKGHLVQRMKPVMLQPSPLPIRPLASPTSVGMMPETSRNQLLGRLKSMVSPGVPVDASADNL